MMSQNVSSATVVIGALMINKTRVVSGAFINPRIHILLKQFDNILKYIFTTRALILKPVVLGVFFVILYVNVQCCLPSFDRKESK